MDKTNQSQTFEIPRTDLEFSHSELELVLHNYYYFLPMNITFVIYYFLFYWDVHAILSGTFLLFPFNMGKTRGHAI